MSELYDMINSPMVAKASSIIRYSSSRLADPESLAVHTHEVCMLGLILIDRIKYVDSSEKIDVGKYLEKAVLHDIEEVSTGDVPRPLKYSSTEVRRSLQKVADIAATTLFQDTFKYPDTYFHYWETSKSGKEGVLLKLVDSLVVLRKSLYEVDILGNKTMLDVVNNAANLFTGYLNHSNTITLSKDDSMLKDFESESVRRYLIKLMDEAVTLASTCLRNNKRAMSDPEEYVNAIHKGEYD